MSLKKQLKKLGYDAHWYPLNASDYGVPNSVLVLSWWQSERIYLRSFNRLFHSPTVSFPRPLVLSLDPKSEVSQFPQPFSPISLIILEVSNEFQQIAIDPLPLSCPEQFHNTPVN